MRVEMPDKAKWRDLAGWLPILWLIALMLLFGQTERAHVKEVERLSPEEQKAYWADYALDVGNDPRR